MSDTEIPLAVIDSSVAFKWFHSAQEAGVAEALDLLRGHADAELLLIAPAHLPAEVLNALRYSGLPNDQLRKAPGALEDASIVLFPLDAGLTARALQTALEYDLTVYDALFAALAAELDAVLVTADRAQARVADCEVRLLA